MTKETLWTTSKFPFKYKVNIHIYDVILKELKVKQNFSANL